MVTIIVAAHGESAPALLKTAGMILGNFENVHPVTFLPGQGPEDLVEEYTRIVEASDAEETLLLVDLFGGSPYNAGAQFAATREGVDGLVEQRGIRVPEQRHRCLVGDLAVDRAGHQLVEHAGCRAPSHRPRA